jgi:hypothetical protein
MWPTQLNAKPAACSTTCSAKQICQATTTTTKHAAAAMQHHTVHHNMPQCLQQPAPCPALAGQLNNAKSADMPHTCCTPPAAHAKGIASTACHQCMPAMAPLARAAVPCAALQTRPQTLLKHPAPAYGTPACCWPLPHTLLRSTCAQIPYNTQERLHNLHAVLHARAYQAAAACCARCCHKPSLLSHTHRTSCWPYRTPQQTSFLHTGHFLLYLLSHWHAQLSWKSWLQGRLTTSSGPPSSHWHTGQITLRWQQQQQSCQRQRDSSEAAHTGTRGRSPCSSSSGSSSSSSSSSTSSHVSRLTTSSGPPSSHWHTGQITLQQQQE